jgi:hypothetical protein
VVPPAENPIPTPPTLRFCHGKSDHPHKSSHVPGTINFVARTYCTDGFKASKLYVKAQLWESRWWGWDRIGSGPPGEKEETLSSEVRANHADTCRKNWVRGTGYHAMFELSGIYETETESIHIEIKSCP